MKNKYVPLFEMAVSRKEIRSEIIHQQWQIIRHYLKINFFPKSLTISHWKRELFGFLKSCHKKIKPTGNYPEKEFYYEHLWNNMDKEEKRSIIKAGIDSLFEKIPDFMYDDLEVKLDEFFIKISNLLSTNQFDKDSLFKILEKNK